MCKLIVIQPKCQSTLFLLHCLHFPYCAVVFTLVNSGFIGYRSKMIVAAVYLFMQLAQLALKLLSKLIRISRITL